jgi:subtilase family serine protease
MRFRRVMAAFLPAGVAAAVAVLVPMGAFAGTKAAPHYAAGHIAKAAAGRVIPADASPLAYRYAGKLNGKKRASGAPLACQQPGASPSCYTPRELATAYDVPSGLTGAGKTIVIIDAFGDPMIAADLAFEDTAFGLPTANLNIIYPNGKPVFDPTNSDEINWSGEIALDVESSHAIAPAAAIDLVIAKSDADADILSALRYAVRHRLGDVLSQSYGEAESCEAPAIVRAGHRLFERASAARITVFASSGDYGAGQPSCDGSTLIKSVGLPAADPLVTGVGATSLTASQPDGAYESETAWNDEYGASNGGYSTLFPRPGYQKGLVPGFARGVPDVSYSGDVNNGLLIAWSQGVAANLGQIYEFGGTSAGPPQWAAIIALADQGSRPDLGFINPRLYRLARGPRYDSVFHDVTTGNNTVSSTDANGDLVTTDGYAAGPRWDAVTGLGTPDVANLISALRVTR